MEENRDVLFDAGMFIDFAPTESSRFLAEWSVFTAAPPRDDSVQVGRGVFR